MADIYNQQRVLGVRLVDDGTVMHNGQRVIGISDAGGALFSGNIRTIGVDVLDADAAIHNEQPVLGAVVIDDGRKLYNGMLVVPAYAVNGSLDPQPREGFAADPTITGSNANNNVNFRGVYTLSDYMGSEFRVGILPGDTNALTSNHVAVGRWDGNDTSPNATTALIETMFGGTPGFANATDIQWSDWTSSGVMAGQPAGTQVVVSFNTGGAGQSDTAFVASPTNSVNYFKADTTAWQDEDVTGYSGTGFNFGVAFIETRGGSPPQTPAGDYIPLTAEDAIFSRNTVSNSPVTITAGKSLVYRTIEENSGNPTFTFQDNTTGSFLSGTSRETVRLGGNTTIQYAYFESVGIPPDDHADTIQVYSPATRGKTINIKNATIKGHNDYATAGFFCSDDWGGAINFEYVVFDGGPYGCRIDASPGCRIELRFKDVYFVDGSFGTAPFLIQDVGTGTHAILQWENVRYATIVNGQIVPGELIPQPAFTPADLTPSLWLEPARGGLFQSNAGVTTAAANNDVVGYLPDLSGNARHYLSGADNTTRPTLQGVGTKPCIRFDGVNDFLMRAESLGLLASPDGYTLAFALKANSPAVDARLFSEGNSASNNTLFIPLQAHNPAATTLSALYRNDAGVQLVNPSTMTNANVFNGSDRVLIITDDGVTIRSYVNGVAGASTNWTRSGTFTIDRSAIGCLLRAASGNWFAFDLYGAVAVSRVISTVERARLTTHEGGLAGLSL